MGSLRPACVAARSQVFLVVLNYCVRCYYYVLGVPVDGVVLLSCQVYVAGVPGDGKALLSCQVYVAGVPGNGVEL